MDQTELKTLITQAVAKVLSEGSPSASSGSRGVYPTIEEAIEKAAIAQKDYHGRTLECRRTLISAIRDGLRPYVSEIAQRAVEESGVGRVEDKVLKNILVLDKTPGVEDLQTGVFTGDGGLTLVELSPFGVIGSITPVTNPTETIICNSIGMLAAGNSVVFCPHPSAVKTSVWLIEIINDLIIKAGGPEGLVCTIQNVTQEAVDVLMSHQKIGMLAITGGTPIVRKGLSSGKKTIGAGAGNPPVIVDETANIENAAKDIFNGASFDNNVPCIAEKSVLVVEDVADYLIFCLEKENVLKLTDPAQIKQLEKTVINEKGTIVKEFVGKNASYILQKAGIACTTDPRLIILETDIHHVFAEEELMMPILPIIRCKNFEEALEGAIHLEHGLRHSAMMHSRNVDRLSEAARRIQTTIFVKNGPSYAGIGFQSEGYTTFTIAGPTGEGLTSAKSFCRIRRCVLKNAFSIR